ncbi:2-oxoglutarate dehydrogenase complex component E1-like isoform X3 [Rhodnius prolixus]|uniref:2-oxoglutarate dehydrogenase complex component E1-like isoform X3 n=1 Tax=Rhodnius prolixus TaxID=13249 RepID=UPI003D18CE6E
MKLCNVINYFKILFQTFFVIRCYVIFLIGSRIFTYPGGLGILDNVYFWLRDRLRSSIKNKSKSSSQVKKVRKIARLLNTSAEQIFEHILNSGNENNEEEALLLNESAYKKNPNIHLIGSLNSATLFPLLMGKSKAMQNLDKDIDNSRVWSICCHTYSEINNKNIYRNIVKLSNIPEYYSGGTIHIIINNEIEGIGTPRCESSCKFLKQMAEHLKAPIVHVQAEDVATVITAMMFGADYRSTYKKDVLIDLMCSSTKSTTANEQLFLSGLLQSFITGRRLPLVTRFMNELIEDELISKSKCDDKRTVYVKKLNKMYLAGKKPCSDVRNFITSNSLVDSLSNGIYKEPATGMSINAVKKIAKAISAKPPFSISVENFNLLEKRKKLMESNQLDWEMCETIAYTSLLKEGFDIHISRSKSKHNPRFLLKNLENDEMYNQVENIFPYMGKYEVSEYPKGSPYGMAGFEIGYSSMNTNTLNIWEVPEMITPQQLHNVFKDFFQMNNYERIINCLVTFITPTYFKVKAKTTDTYCSAQPQKIIEACCESNVTTNMIEQLYNTNAIVANISTPANFYHLLKRQAISSIQRPLIIFTPNNFEMSDKQWSMVQEITRDSSFQCYISDDLFTNNSNQYGEIKDVILCSGTMYYTLLEERSKRKLEKQIPISRIEQIHPLPYNDLFEDIQRFPNATIWWAQEEDFVHGWWNFIESRLTALFGNKIKIKYAGRRKLASKVSLTTKISDEDLTYIFNCLEET